MRLSRTLTVMALFLLAVVGLGAWLIVRLEGAFRANPVLNAVLIAVWLIGIVYILTQTIRLGPEIRWVWAVQRNRMAASELDTPPLMGSLARLMESRATPLAMTPPALRAVLDGIAVRLDERRETARYFVGLLIFLGLLGTFWGLLKTVGSVGGVVNGLSVTADPAELFTNLKAGLQGPLDGMATAFGSSLLGLAGSLALGFLDLQMGHAQSRFFIDLEDWLFAAFRGGESDESGATSEAMLRALIEQTTINIEHFREIVTGAEEGRRQSAAAIQTLARNVGQLAEAQDRGVEAISRSTALTEATGRMLWQLNEVLVAKTGANDDHAISEHLAAIEAIVSRIADVQAEARARSQEEMRNELRRLARTVGVTIDDRDGR